jgi:eukaryotic-like serine/threonine-protein kinase
VSVASGQVKPLLTSTANEGDAVVSPYGRWVAYVSDETARNEVYVQSFPDAGGKASVSRNGGDTPRWSAAGDNLFYREQSTIMVAHIDGGGRPGIAKPVVAAPPNVTLGLGFDVTPDGRFAVAAGLPNLQAAATHRVRVLFGWSPPGDNRTTGR